MENKTIEELNKRIKLLKVVAKAMAVALILLLAVTIYGLLTKENKTVFITLLPIVFGLSTILLLQYSSVKKIKEEIKQREK
ncbi:hypothetical protein F7018_13845 [Tenacibaculum aiptasiae]|uniref:Redox-active disulfide protein 2 n=1 Tax=Tenacibaculum aiptasiae TaxID=426481 RepID=A0A7J5AAM5_9FLAO|nr:hypothetical protein [Tenacibaculum aiptasiae]KAB1154606.1 hypothetical protein F7018_13845 [Tenacibaculum aiptasiae]